jgi:hypothetical protein
MRLQARRFAVFPRLDVLHEQQKHYYGTIIFTAYTESHV